MAHIAVAIGVLGLLVPIIIWPPAGVLLLVPVALSVLIIRLRTVADTSGLTVRTLRSSRFVSWSDIEGLQFTKGSAARAHLNTGEQVRLPAVTFSTLPLLTEISGGRVPNPYA
jgi:hypothetical protein